MWDFEMEEARVKVDSKGRIRIPPEMREGLGEVVALRRTPDGILVSPESKSKDFFEGFRSTLLSNPPRTGKPENWSPGRMKEVWK
jgi:bifunctional DNA-binding transcriptional regulator/antitoxin component of YhaV-PrlF toxin-antitoxin module